MNIHKNARLTPLRREEMARAVIAGTPSRAAAARHFGVSVKTVGKWVKRFACEGIAGMIDRSSRPEAMPSRTPQRVVKRIVELRRQRWTGRHMARHLGVSPATVSRVLKRAGLASLKDLAPAEPVRRYDYAEPGGLIHIDIKKLGRFERAGHRVTGDRTGQSNSRGIGWEFVHVAIDDHSRIAFSRIMPDETRESAIAFLQAAMTFYAGLGIKVGRIMTDNGSCYVARSFARTCQTLAIKHKRTRPYTPRTNGKAERFIQTALREWAYAQACSTSECRKAEMPVFLHRHNWHRPHSSLANRPPISRLPVARNNLLLLHS